MTTRPDTTRDVLLPLRCDGEDIGRLAMPDCVVRGKEEITKLSAHVA
jgi:hypothetical protein